MRCSQHLHEASPTITNPYLQTALNFVYRNIAPRYTSRHARAETFSILERPRELDFNEALSHCGCIYVMMMVLAEWLWDTHFVGLCLQYSHTNVNACESRQPMFYHACTRRISCLIFPSHCLPFSFSTWCISSRNGRLPCRAGRRGGLQLRL